MLFFNSSIVSWKLSKVIQVSCGETVSSGTTDIFFVLRTCLGIAFIPPHLVGEVITTSEGIHLYDEFRKQRLQGRKYTADQVYVGVWGDEIEAAFQE